MSDQRPLDPEAERAIAKVRRLVMIASVTTFLAVAAVLVVIGYRISQLGESSSQPPRSVPALPPGAKVLSSAVGDNRVVLTVEIDGVIELRSYDLKTLQPEGRVVLTPKRQ